MADAKQYLDQTGLSYYDTKVQAREAATYVAKEKKTGSSDQYKVLSDNNLTDEMVEKIRNAGDSTFSGNFDDLAGIPTLNGKELKGTLTDDGLGLATDEELAGVKSELQTKIGTDIGTAKEELTGTINSTKSELTGTINATKTELQAEIDSDVAAAKSEMQTYVDGKVASTYKPAGSVTTLTEVPEPSKDVLGNVYNVVSAFVTNEKFVEGTGKDYPAGTNVAIVEPSTGTYKYDALAGFVDLSNYATKGELPEITAIPTTAIDGLFD